MSGASWRRRGGARKCLDQNGYELVKRPRRLAHFVPEIFAVNTNCDTFTMKASSTEKARFDPDRFCVSSMERITKRSAAKI